MNAKQIPPKAIDALERAITREVQHRIDEDPDVTDAYLRIGIHEKSFTVLTLYLEESNASQLNRDVALQVVVFIQLPVSHDEHGL